MSGPKRRMTAWLVSLAALYLVVAFAVPRLAASMLYYPNYGSRRAPEGLQKLKTDAGEIAFLHLPNPNARYTLWFFHGNAEDLGDLEPMLLALRAQGFAVFAFDYPGYGLSGGAPSEKAIYAAARAARAHLREALRVPAERTILFGRSLGGGPAVQLATEERVGGLVLQSTFVSVLRVVTRWRLLPFDQYENLRKLDRVHCPVLVMHGTADEVIPFWHGEKLFAAAHEPKRCLWIAGARHNDFTIVAGEKLPAVLRDFSALCAQSAAAAMPAQPAADR